MFSDLKTSITKSQPIPSESVTEQSSSRLWWSMATLYGLVSCFFLANFYTFGISYSFFQILLALSLLAPLYGAVSFSAYAKVLQLTGRWFGGQGTMGQISLAIASSKLPYVISLAMWVWLAIKQKEFVFFHYASSSSAVLIILLSLTVFISSFCLLLRSLRDIQSFSQTRACLNAMMSLGIIFLLSLIVMLLVRYVYIEIK